jgi:hypothetical protein
MSYLSLFCFDTVLSPMPKFPKLSLSMRFSNQNFVRIFQFRHTTCSSRLAVFYHIFIRMLLKSPTCSVSCVLRLSLQTTKLISFQNRDARAVFLLSDQFFHVPLICRSPTLPSSNRLSQCSIESLY